MVKGICSTSGLENDYTQEFKAYCNNFSMKIRNLIIFGLVSAGAGVAGAGADYLLEMPNARKAQMLLETVRSYEMSGESSQAERYMFNALKVTAGYDGIRDLPEDVDERLVELRKRIEFLELLDRADGVNDNTLTGDGQVDKIEALPFVDREMVNWAKNFSRVAAYESTPSGREYQSVADGLGIPYHMLLAFYGHVDQLQHGQETGSLDMPGEELGTVRLLWGLNTDKAEKSE